MNFLKKIIRRWVLSLLSEGIKVGENTVYVYPTYIDVGGGSLRAVGDVSGSLIPTYTNTYDLGSTDKYWKDAFISGSIHGTAGVTIPGSYLTPDSVEAGKLASGSVQTANIANLAITEALIAAGAITEVKINTAAITEAKLAANAVTETKIASGSISTPKLVAGAIQADQIATGAVTTEKIDALAVNADKIAANAVTTAKIDALAVNAAKIAAGAVSAQKLAIVDWYPVGLTWTDNSPSAGYVAWSACTMYYNGNSYSVAGGNTNLQYIWWDFTYPTAFQTSATKPTLTGEDAMVAVNRAGTHHQILQATLIDGGSILTASIYADEIGAGAITSAKISSDQIFGKDFRTAENVGDAGGPAGVRFDSSGIRGYLGGTTKTFQITSADGIVGVYGTIDGYTGYFALYTAAGVRVGDITALDGSPDAMRIVGQLGVLVDLICWTSDGYSAYKFELNPADQAVYSDLHILPSSNGAYNLGSSTFKWGTVYCNYPQLTPVTVGTMPTANSANNGKLCYTHSAGGKGHLWICMQNDADGYEWVQVAIST